MKTAVKTLSIITIVICSLGIIGLAEEQDSFIGIVFGAYLIIHSALVLNYIKDKK